MDIYESGPSDFAGTIAAPFLAPETIAFPIVINSTLLLRSLHFPMASSAGVSQMACALYRAKPPLSSTKDQLLSRPLTYPLSLVSGLGGVVSATGAAENKTISLPRDIVVDPSLGAYFLVARGSGNSVRLGFAGNSLPLGGHLTEPLSGALGSWPTNLGIGRNNPSLRGRFYFVLRSALGAFLYTNMLGTGEYV